MENNMTTTAQRVFDLAIHLMDEQNESNGETDTSDTSEYKSRTLSILNVIRHECWPCSENYEASAPRKLCPRIETLESVIQMDDAVVEGVMPYGLAARLLADENPALANFFEQKYSENIAVFLRRRPAVSEAVENLYGGCEHVEYGRWE